MTGAFGWLNSLLTTFGKLFPRIVLIRLTHRGVLFQRSGSIRVLQPGLRIYWPVTTHIRQIPIITRSWEIQPVVVDSRDLSTQFVDLPVSRSAGAIIHVRVSDVAKSIEVYHMAAAVATVVTGALCKFWHDGPEAIEEQVIRQLAEWGIEVTGFAVTDSYEQIMFGPHHQTHQHHQDSTHKDDSGALRERDK